MANLSDYLSGTHYKAVVKSTKRFTPPEAEDIREIIIEVQDKNFHCDVDQSFGVIVKYVGPFGNNVHHRLYTIANSAISASGLPEITMLVKRCYYVDDFSGEKYEGVASNYLCNRNSGDELLLTGPHSLPYAVPEDKTSNIILIGMGTGIAPFKSFVRHIYKNVKTGKEKSDFFMALPAVLICLYLNDKEGDLTNYYDQKTFEAFYALSPRPHWADPIAMDKMIEGQSDEIKRNAFQKQYLYLCSRL
jgi:ferredoxin--NADP+ reductase